MTINRTGHAFPGLAGILVAAISWNTNAAMTADAYKPFTGEKTSCATASTVTIS